MNYIKPLDNPRICGLIDEEECNHIIVGIEGADADAVTVTWHGKMGVDVYTGKTYFVRECMGQKKLWNATPEGVPNKQHHSIVTILPRFNIEYAEYIQDLAQRNRRIMAANKDLLENRQQKKEGKNVVKFAAFFHKNNHLNWRKFSKATMYYASQKDKQVAWQSAEPIAQIPAALVSKFVCLCPLLWWNSMWYLSLLFYPSISRSIRHIVTPVFW